MRHGRMELDVETAEWIDGMARRAAVEVNEEQRRDREFRLHCEGKSSALRGFAATILTLLAAFVAICAVVGISGCSGDMPPLIEVKTPEIVRNVAVAVSAAIVDADQEMHAELPDDLAQKPGSTPSTGLETPGSSPPPPADPATAAHTDDPGTDVTPDVGRFCHRIQVGRNGGTCVCIGDGVFVTCRHLFEDAGNLAVSIDGTAVYATFTLHRTHDVAVVKARHDAAAAQWSTQEPEYLAEAQVFGFGSDTVHGGVLSDYETLSLGRDDAGITQGDSGGGVFVDGVLVGVVRSYTGDGGKTVPDNHRAVHFTPLSMVAGTLAPFTPVAASAAHNPHADAPGADDLRDAIARYRNSGGQRWLPSGQQHTSRQHLVSEHGWTTEQLQGLNQSELDYLHGACHTGVIDAGDYGVPAAATEPDGDLPVVTIWSPSTWGCSHCVAMKAHDWSGLPFRIEDDYDDDVEDYLRSQGWRGEWRGFPVVTWRGANGKLFILQGERSPKQLLSSWEQTQ